MRAQPGRGPAGTTAPSTAALDPLDGGSGDNDAPPAAAPSSADPLRAERRRSNQLEKELRKARAQLSRFAEINPNEYACLQDAERKRQLNEANLSKERLMERLFSEAEGRQRYRSRYRSWR